ncbi:MAG TPA: YjjG family noncanonical pyrimidine nucleotidase [Prolixibacteraceae bacterium]|nr:YjjG family noncanonical pyrimidine nucleotidase [Prolixibacteraceae bacterium]
MTNKKYKHVYFDLDNTLWDFNQNSRRAMQLAFQEFKIAENSQVGFEIFFDVYSGHNRLLWKQYRNRQVTKNELIVKRFNNTFEDLNIKGINPDNMNAFYLQVMPGSNVLVNGALDVLRYLKKKNYALYIITNGFKEVQYQKLKGSGILPFFDKVYISEVIKKNKPAKEVFEYAVKSANAKKKQSIMVGDDWEADILGALNFGIDAVYFSQNKNGNKTKAYPKNKLYRIDSLHELTKIL